MISVGAYLRECLYAPSFFPTRDRLKKEVACPQTVYAAECYTGTVSRLVWTHLRVLQVTSDVALLVLVRLH